MKLLRDHPVDEFVNWSGSLRFTPGAHVWPDDEAALQAYVLDAAMQRRHLRVAGAGHSSSPLVRASDLLVCARQMRGLIDYDLPRARATLGPATSLHDAGSLLHEVGLGMENLGDVDTQTIAGVVSTGTHGSGRRLRNISSTLVGVRLITGTGDVAQWSFDDQPELLRAARVALGALGIFTSLSLQLQPAYRLRRREYAASTQACLANLDALADAYRNLDFYWYPRRDETKIRTLHPPDEPAMPLPFARCVKEEVGYSHEVIARVRDLRFEEMEYFVPAAAGPECFRALRRRILERHRKHVCWRVLYRLIAADDAWLSPACDRDSVAISVHQNVGLPYQEYFDDLEPICRAHEGRPHWGKKHSLSGAALASLYPQWRRFMDLRRRLDPAGVFLSPDLRELLGEERT